MHIKSIVSDEDREELERMLSLGFIIPNQLFKTRQKSRMIIYIFTPVEFLLSINCYLSESYLMFGIGIGTCVACVAWIIWYQMIGKNFEKNVHEFVWGRSGYETVDIDENAIKIDDCDGDCQLERPCGCYSRSLAARYRGRQLCC